MRAPHYLLLAAFLLMSGSIMGQNFYEIKWTGASDIEYKALLVYYSADDAYARVQYYSGTGENKEYRVAEFKCSSRYETGQDGKQHFIVDGHDAKMITSGGGEYNADNFVYSNVNDDNEYESIWVIDDYDWEQEDYLDRFREAEIETLDPKTKFTESYINSFFGTSDPEYKVLLSYADPMKYLTFDDKSDNSVGNNNTTTTTTYSTTGMKLHLILVANTLDNSIGLGCDVDRRKLVNEFNNIAETLGIGIDVHQLYDRDFTKAKVEATIDALTVGSEDIVLFFYRGHGYRYDNQTDSYPMMAMRYSEYQELEGLSLSDVYYDIIKKGGRLNLVFGDMCNNEIGLSQSVNLATTSLQTNFYPSVNKLQKLFLEAEGNVISTAASPGEVSWVNNYDGGFFTQAFFDSFHKEVSKTTGDGDWNNLINTTIDNARYKSTFLCTNCTEQNGIKYVEIQY